MIFSKHIYKTHFVSFCILILFAIPYYAFSLNDSTYKADILGENFMQKSVSLGQNQDGEIIATIIKYMPEANTSKAILYVHGYNDYFFQTQAAEKFAEQGYRFYAVDLRGYGRSYRAHQYPFHTTDLSEYFQDIDTAIAIMKMEGCKQIILMAHSTGGLISSLYANKHKDKLPFDALVLNSPFLDMNLSPFEEKVGIPIVSGLGKCFPMAKVNTALSNSYAHSLLKSYNGEWEFDTNFKYIIAPKLTMGWVRAIHRGHKIVQKGMSIPCPILLMSSDTSVYGNTWTPAHQKGDAVLNVNDIHRYGSTLGPKVKSVKFAGGLHDLILSEQEVRNNVYSYIFDFLKTHKL